MPTIQNSSRGQVVQIWGKAYVRGTDGVWRPLVIGETVPQGAEILTEQDAIVMMTRSETPLPKIAESPVERAIAAVENNEAPPAAGLLGGGSGDLQPGLRVDRIVELVTPGSLVSGLDAATVEFGRATRSDPGASAIEAPRLVAASSSITSVEEGSSVNLGLPPPIGPGTLTITVTGLPAIGQVFTAAGTPVTAGTVLTADELAGLIYTPPADYVAGTPVGSFGYTVNNGIDNANGGTRIAVTPVNDAPLAIDGSHSGAEDILLDVSLSGTDIDGTVASVSVATPPTNGTLLLRDTLAPVAVGALLTPAQAAGLVFRPNPNWNGSTSFTFTVTDNDGAVSAPATVQLQITPVNDPPLAVNDSSSTVAQAPVTVAVLGNDSDADNDPLTVTNATVSAALGSVVVNGNGTLTFTAAPGVTGPVAINYTIADPSGATSTATLTINVAAAPTVTVDAPALTNDTTPTLTGSSNLPPGSTVTLTVTGANGAVQTFTTTVRADGTYSVDVPAPLAEGPYTAVANVNGPGGTTATANDNGIIDVTPPVITVDAPALTNDSTPPLTGTTDLPPGSTITLTVTGANGVSQLFSTTVQAGGVFSVDVPANLVSGPFTVIASGTDAAGNTATSTDNGVVDAVPPVITVDAPALTNDTTPALTGTTDLPAGSTITLTVTGANGAVQTFTTTVQAGGVYSVDVPAALVEGNFNVVASGTDAAGNTAAASDNGLIDVTAPTVTVDAPALTNDTTPPLTGTTNLPAGSTVTLTVTGANSAVQTFTAPVQAGGTFSVDVPAALVQGNFSVTATATDAAGNSASATDTGLIDTTPPAATLAIDPVTADNIVNAGEATGSITITGTVGGDVQVGDTVTLNVNGVTYTGLVLAGNTFAITVPGAGVLADADRRIDGSVTTTDAAGNSTTATAQRPYSVNSAPIAVNDALSVGEDTASAGSDVTPGTPAQDRDADGDILTVIGVVTGAQTVATGNVNTPLVGTWGTLLLDSFGAYTYAPSAAAQALDPGQTVTDTFTYTIEDGRGGSATATLTISVVGTDDPTTISGVFIGTVTEDAVATASGTLTNNDPDVGTRAFVAQANSAGTYGLFSIDAAGTWTYTLTNAAANVQALAQGQSVTETFIVATDDGTTASITVTVSGANDAPVVSSTSINAVEEGAAVGLGLAVPSDIDNGSVLTITVSGLPTIGQVQLADGTPVANGATLSAAQLAGLRYLPPADYSGAPVGTFAYTVSDGITSVNGGTTINVSAVNDRPVAIDVSASGFEDTTTRIAVTPAGSDVDGTISSYTLASVPANGSLFSAATGGTPLAVGAVITGPVYFQPNPNFNGSVTFNYTATDNGGAVSANSGTATIVVNPVNDAPTLTGLVATYNYSEGGTPTVVRSVIDGSVVLADIDSPNFGGGTVTVSIANVVTAEDLLGVRNQGTGNGQISVSGTTVSYNPAGTDPLVAIGTISGGTGSAPLVITFNANASVAAVDALLQNITYGNASQLPTTTPRSLTITIVDGDGTANGGADTVSTNVTVNITRVNDAPLFTALNGGVVNTTEGAAPALLDTNATVNDPELGSGYVGAINNMGGAVLTLARVGGANAQDQFSASGGTLALAGGNVVLGGNTVGTYDTTSLANGTLQITFASGTTQADATSVLRQIRYVNTSDAPPASVAIGYTVNDGNTGSQGTGGARTGTATVTVNIAPVNDAPVAANDSETTSENTPLAASVPAAIDADGTIASYALVAGVGAGNGALVFNNDGTFTFNPGSDFDALSVGASRDVIFTYIATDNSGAVSNVATVTITVTGTNDGPVAFDAAQTTGENSTLTANVPAGSDVDGTVSSYALVGNVGANNGTLNFNADGTYSFATGSDFDSLAAGQSRDVTFTYTATDNDGAVSTPATVTITVTGANDAPTGADAAYAIAEDGSRAFVGADFGFSDIDIGDTLAAVRIDSLPTAGTLTLNGSAVTATQVIAAADLANLVFTPLANTTGAPYASFTFSVQDNGGLFDSAPNTITFNVTPDNDPPLAVVTPASGNEDTPIAVSLTGTDIDGSVTAVTVTALPSNGTLYLADGVTPVVANTPLSVVAAASLIFRPAPDFNGTVNLSFTVTDNNGAVSAPAVSPITVAPVVDPVISISDVIVNESAGTVTFTVTLDQPTTAPVSVNFTTGNGTASAGADYTALTGTVSFAPGVISRTIEVTIADDGTFEGSETFNVVLSGAVNATIADATGVATIVDNDTPTIAVSSPTAAEGGFAVFTVSLSNASTTAVTFNPTLASGTATVGTDTDSALEYFNGTAWVAVPVGGVTLAAGTTSVQVRVATTDDAAAEGSETFALTATVTAGTTANASATGTATITDDTDVTTVALTATPSVAEGGNITYTATLTNAAVTPLTVTLSSGQTITIAAGTTANSISVPAPGDDPYLDGGNVSRTIASTSGGGFESLSIDATAAVTNVTDTIDVTTATLTATPSVVEGGQITWTVSLAAPVTGSDVTVTLAGGQTITIPVGASSGFATGTAPDDVFSGGGSVTNNIVSASGGNFEQLTPDTAPVTTAVTDDADATTVTLTATPSVVEGGSILYTAALTNAAQTPVTVTLSNGATITIAAGATSNFVSVSAPSDDPYLDAGNVSTTISSATGGGFEQLDVNPAPAVTSVTDDVDATTVTLTATANVAEGGSIIYTATLSNAAQTPVTVTLSTGQTITIASGDLDGSIPIPAPTDDVYLDGSTVSRTISSATGGNFEALNVDATPAATTVTDTINTTTVSITGGASVAEGATASYTVSMTSLAQTPVTINLTYSGTAIDGTDFTGVATVTIPAGSSDANFNLTTLQDALAEGAESFTVTIASAAGGNFENLVISSANGAQTTSITDDDTPTIAVSSPNLTEGGFAVFTVSLSNASTTAVVFTPSLASGSATVGTDTGTSLEYFDGSAWVAVPIAGVTIAAGSTSVQVRVATTDDFAAEGDETFALTATVSSGNTGNASASGTATISDDTDATTVTLTATPSVAEGGTITYTATLANAAVSPMTVALSNGATIVIAAGDTAGSTPFAAPTEDAYIDAGNVSATITSTSGGGFEAVTINTTAAVTSVSDTIDTTTATLTATPSVAEGGQITWTVSLAAPVTGSDVTVTLAGGQTITIPVGASSGFATGTAPDNVFAGGGSVANNIVSATGGNFEQLTPNTAPVTTTVTDDADVTTVSLTATASVVEGTSITYTATLTTAAQTPVTVTLSNGATITIAAGDTVGTALVSAPGDDAYLDAATVSATIATATGGNFESLQIDAAPASTDVTDDVDATTVSLAATPSVAEGGNIIYTATLTNAAQTPVTVTLSTGQTITIAAGDLDGSVSILAPADDVYIDGSTVARSIDSASGGNFEALNVNTTPAATIVTDTINTTTVSITGDASVAEGATAAYTVSLTSAAQTAVTVNLTYSGMAIDGTDFTGVATVTIAAGASSAPLNIASLSDVLAEGVENFIVTIASAAGGNFESLVVSSTNGAQTTAIIDDDTPALSVSSPSVGEGGFAVFTVSLSNASTTAVTFNPTLASGSATVGTDTSTALEFFNGTAWIAVPVGGVTLAAGTTSVQVRVATTDDVALEGNEIFTLTATVTAGTTANASANGTATITDDVDVTTVALTATPSVAEGGSITYTATLSSAAVSAMAVTLSSGQTINIAAGATVGSISILAPSDDPYLDAGTVSRTITSTSGGGFESLSIDATAAETTVTDTIDVTSATLTATSSVAEGGQITYTVALGAAVTGSAVSVLLANGQTVTIPVGSSSNSVVAIAPDNLYGGGAAVGNSIVSVSGGNFEQLTPDTTPVSTSVTDDGDVTTVSLSATASVIEGTQITYTATLTNPAQTPVTVTLSNGATITIAAGDTFGTAVVSAPGDDVYLDASTVSATIATATGGNFESLQINPAAADTNVTDDSDPTTLNLSATASVAEGGSIIYTATLSNAAQTPMTITLSTGQTITIAAGDFDGSVTILAPTDDVYVDAGSVTRTISTTSGGNFENLQLGTASATTTVSDTIDTTTVSITGSSTVAEGATASCTVSLTSAAQTAVTVNLTYTGTAADGSDYTGVASVTIPAGFSSAAFNIATLQDVIGEGAENFTVTIASAAGGNFENLVISSANGAQTTSITDDDTPTIAVSSPTVGEGGLAVFTVSLSNASATAVTFNPSLSSGTATVGADTSTALEYFNGTAWVAVPVGGVTIAAGSTSVQVRVATTDDFALEGDENFTLTATVTAGITGNASAFGTATITDDVDGTTLSLAATPNVAEGGSILYTATLTNAAVTPMTVTLSTGQTITIAAGDTVGTLSIAAPGEDPYVDASIVSRAIASTSGGGLEALTVNPAAATTTVSDTIDTTTLSISGSTTVVEGASGSYTVSLTSSAQTAVTVNLTYSGTAANGVDFTGVATVTILAGDSSASFNIDTINDLIDEVAAESFTVTVASATGGNFENLVISGTNNSVTTAITDNDNAPTIAVSSQTVGEADGFAVFTLSLSNPSSTATMVSLVLADGSATGADYGSSLEVSNDGGATWTSTSSATFAAGATSVLVRTPIANDALDEADETFTLTATRTAGTTANASAVGSATIADNDATPSLSINDVTVNESAGTVTFTVTLSAASGQPVSVDVATSNGSATDSADYLAVPSTTLNFAPGVLTQLVTVTINDDGTYEGAENFNVLLSGAVNATIADGSGLGTINDNDIPALAVSSPSVGEGGFAVFTVSLSNPSTTAVTFNPTLASGTATVGTDTSTALEYFNGTAWVAVPVGGVTMAAGSTSVQVRVATTDDFALEGNETFSLTATVTAGTTSNASAAGTATIVDDGDTTTVALTATPSVVEGGGITYTATLTQAAVTPLTVTLSTGQTITIAAGALSGTVSIGAPGDDPYLDASTVSRTIATTSGGGFEALTIDTTAAETTVTDDVDATTVSLTATPSVTEGGSILYTATLSNAAQTAVTVTLSTGQTITIAAGDLFATLPIAAPTDDVYVDGSTVSRTISSASGGNFELLNVNAAAALTTITDTIDTVTATLTATPSVAEGGTITYTVSLPATVTGSAVAVTLAGGQTVTIPVGSSSAFVNSTAPDNAYAGGGSIVNSISSISGGNFEQLTPSAASVTTAVTDDADATTLTLTATGSVVEGNNITYTATLNNAAQTPVTVTLSTGQTITIAAGALFGTVLVAAPGDDPYIDAGNVSRTISSATGGGFEVLAVSPTAAVTAITDDIDATTLALTATPSVVEGGNITYTATLTNAAQTAVTVTLSTGQTITIAAGTTFGTVQIAAPSDDVYIDTSTVSRTISTATGGNFELLTINPAAASTTVTDDNDGTTVTLTATPSVVEGGDITYTATLTNVAQTAVMVTLSTGQTITIAAGALFGTVQIAAPADDVYVDASTVSRTITSTTGGNFESLTINPAAASTNITDDGDVTNVTLTATANVAEGGSILYTATLTNAAQTPVTVTLSSGQTITIAAGALFGTVSILAPTEDVYVDAGTVSRTITSATGGNFEALAVNPAAAVTNVSDTIGTTTLSISGSTTVVEGASGSYTISLTSPAQTAVTVNLTYSGTAANGVDFTGVATVTILAGASNATFNIDTINDLIDEVAAESFTVTVASATGGNFENLAISGANNSVTTAITDNDNAPTMAVSSPTVAESGGFAVFTLSLSNPSSTATTVSLALANGATNPATGGGTDYGSGTATNLQVSTDGGTTWANATSATFAAGATSVLVRTPIANDVLDEADETFSLTATRTAGTTANASAAGTATITDNDATPSLSIGNVSVNESAGTMTFNVVLSAASGQTVTVNFGTGGGSATVVNDYQGISGTLTFAPGVISQSITVNIAEDAITELSETFNVTLSAAGNATIGGTGIGVGTIVDNDTPPQGRDATVAATEDTPFVFALGNFLMNDAEQGNNVNPSSVRIDTLPSNGSLYLSGVLVTLGQIVSAADITAGRLSFEPASNANGTNYANFNFSVRDASGQFDLAPNTITVNVAAVSDGAPDARNDMFMTTGVTPIILTAAQLLANDTLPDGATITSVGAASGGTLVNNGNGTYTWTPSGPGNGTFTYTLTDQDGQTDTATVRIVSTGANDDLATVNESALADGTGAGTITATGNLFSNDSGNTAVNSITFNGTTVTDGGAGDIDARAGFIGVNSTDGRLVVDSAGAGAGDYTYTLLDNADNSAVANDTSVTEVFSYDANAIDAALRVTISDDAPQAISRTVQVSEDQVPSYRLVLVLDVSGSMDSASAGGEVRQVNSDGSVTISTRLALARQALAQLVTEYYNQAQNVSITLITFSDVATVVNPGTPYTSKDAAVAAILAADGTGGTNYSNALTATQSAFGAVDPAVRNAIYFLSDGAPSGGDLTAPAASSGYSTFVTNNNIDSYAVGIGTGIANTGPLNGIHNVDANGNGTSDGAIIVPDLNDLGSALLSTVPVAYGGNVVSSSADGNVLGADGGNIQTVTIRLDTNGDGTRDTDVTFTRNTGTNQISSNNAFPSGFPITGDLLTLGTSRGFPLGTLTFNFSTGDYTYFTGGTASEGDSFSFSFVARDGDGDITAPSTLTVEIADGHPVARPDSDTLTANQTRLEGNVITGLGTDGGQALGGSLTNFSSNGAGVDDAIDGAQLSSVAFKGVNYALGSNATGSGAGFTWSVAGGQLTWTATSGGEQLIMASSGYYQYTPPTATLPAVLTGAAVTTLFNSAANAALNGVTLGGIGRTGTSPGLNYNNPNGTGDDGVGVNGGDANGTIDNLETLVVSFNNTTHPQGVQGVSFNVSANQSNLGDNGSGTIRSLTYTAFDVAGNELGQFYSTGEGTVTMPAQYSNIGRIEIEANSAADARITSVSFSSVNVNNAAAEVAPVEVGYTLTDTDGDSSNATLTLRTMSNNLFGDGAANTLTGTNANDRIDGAAGNDTLNGGAGNDLLIGGAGADTLAGGDGIDELRGGVGNDIVGGGNGNDILVGGMGNDALTGGAGADVFRWELADRGVAGSPATDTLADFSTAQGDRLDLRDLLQGETLDGGAIGNLSNYLFVERTGSNTTVHISSTGGFTSGYNAGAEDQTIVLTGIDLTAASTLTSQQVIQELLNNNRLSVDA